MSASRRQFVAPQKTAHPVVTKTVSSSHLRRQLTAYGIRHIQAALLSLGQISRAPLATLMICLVMGIALALPTGLFVLLKNVAVLNQHWDSRSPIMLYLKIPTTDTQAQTLLKQIAARPDVAKVQYISPEAGLAEFQQQSDLGSVLSGLKQNPLPAVLVVTPKVEDIQSSTTITALRDALQTLPQVEVARVDIDWVQRLDALLLLAGKLVLALAVILSLGVILIVGSTIHLALQSHHDEIEVYRLVGATNGFIRRPFLYRGIIYGLAGSLVAAIIVSFTLYWLNSPVKQLTKLYNSNFVLQGLGFGSTMSLLLLGMLLGWLGAWIAVHRHSYSHNS